MYGACFLDHAFKFTYFALPVALYYTIICSNTLFRARVLDSSFLINYEMNLIVAYMKVLR